MPEIERAPDDRPLFNPMWPGYFAVKRKLAGITRFRDLIIHRERWAGADQDASPVQELFPDLAPGTQPTRDVIDREIKRAQRPVHFDLNFAHVPTGVIHKEFDHAKNGMVETSYDVILDYFRLPRDHKPHLAYEATMNTLEQGIGTYQVALSHARRELYDPVAWLAKVIRIPITVMERAGFGGHEKTQELMLGGYVRFIKIAMGAFIIVVTLLLGIKIPWKEIVAGAIDYIFK
jgi:hypothetical protein